MINLLPSARKPKNLATTVVWAPPHALEALKGSLASGDNGFTVTEKEGVSIYDTKREKFIFFSDKDCFNHRDFTERVDNFFTVLNFDEDLSCELNKIPESLHKATRKYIIGTTTGNE